MCPSLVLGLRFTFFYYLQKYRYGPFLVPCLIECVQIRNMAGGMVLTVLVGVFGGIKDVIIYCRSLHYFGDILNMGRSKQLKGPCR